LIGGFTKLLAEQLEVLGVAEKYVVKPLTNYIESDWEVSVFLWWATIKLLNIIII